MLLRVCCIACACAVPLCPSRHLKAEILDLQSQDVIENRHQIHTHHHRLS